MKVGGGKFKITANMVPNLSKFPFSDSYSLSTSLDTKFEGNPVQFKFKSKAISSHFDLGVWTIQPQHSYLNTYIAFNTPRVFNSFLKQNTTTIGGVYHIVGGSSPTIANF